MRCVVTLLLLALAAAAQNPGLRDPDAAFWREHAPALYRVKFETTAGTFLLEVHRDWAPIGADRFYNLVRAGFYDDSRFYRVTQRFVQFGIAGKPDVAQVWRERRIKDDPVKETNTRGRFALAMTARTRALLKFTSARWICPRRTKMGSPLWAPSWRAWRWSTSCTRSTAKLPAAACVQASRGVCSQKGMRTWI